MRDIIIKRCKTSDLAGNLIDIDYQLESTNGDIIVQWSDIETIIRYLRVIHEARFSEVKFAEE